MARATPRTRQRRQLGPRRHDDREAWSERRGAGISSALGGSRGREHTRLGQTSRDFRAVWLISKAMADDLGARALRTALRFAGWPLGGMGRRSGLKIHGPETGVPVRAREGLPNASRGGATLGSVGSRRCGRPDRGRRRGRARCASRPLVRNRFHAPFDFVVRKIEHAERRAVDQQGLARGQTVTHV